MSARNSVSDFIRDVGLRTNATGTIVYVGPQNSSGSVKITRNGVTVYANVFWNDGATGAGTDAAAGGKQQGDSVTILDGAGGIAKGDAQQFIQSLI